MNEAAMFDTTLALWRMRESVENKKEYFESGKAHCYEIKHTLLLQKMLGEKVRTFFKGRTMRSNSQSTLLKHRVSQRYREVKACICSWPKQIAWNRTFRDSRRCLRVFLHQIWLKTIWTIGPDNSYQPKHDLIFQTWCKQKYIKLQNPSKDV